MNQTLIHPRDEIMQTMERIYRYGVQYQNDGSIADFVSTAAPAAILENDGVLVTGSSVLDAFDRLEVLESTAAAVINARAIGEVAAMPDAVMHDVQNAVVRDNLMVVAPDFVPDRHR